MHHIPGKQNAAADYLSRCPSELPEEGECVTALSMANTIRTALVIYWVFFISVHKA